MSVDYQIFPHLINRQLESDWNDLQLTDYIWLPFVKESQVTLGNAR